MSEKKIQRNIMLYGFFQALRESLFWGPILIYYMQRVAAMSLSGIYLMESCVVIFVFLLQVPTGALADLIGRRKTILLGSLFLAADCLLFSLANNQMMIWLADGLWAIGYSLASGADSSLLYDSLVQLGKTHEFKKIEGRSISYRFMLIAIASIFSGYLAKVNIRLPVLLGLPGLLVTCAIAYFFVEPTRIANTYNAKNHWQMMKLSVLFVANNQRVKWIIAYVVLLGVAGKVWFFTYNPYFELVGLPLAYYGWLFFGINLVAAVFSFSANWLDKRLPAFLSLSFMVGLTGVPILLMASIVALPMVLLVLLQNVVRGYLKPFMGHFLHDHLDSENRATVASIQAAIDAFAQFIFLGLFGLILKIFPLTGSLMLLGAVTLIFGLYLLIRFPMIFRPKTS